MSAAKFSLVVLKLTMQVHKLVSAVLEEGDIAVDATAGNRWDTAFLMQLIADTGVVYVIDLQEEAVVDVL